jgi:hypothetical protein
MQTATAAAEEGQWLKEQLSTEKEHNNNNNNNNAPEVTSELLKWKEYNFVAKSQLSLKGSTPQTYIYAKSKECCEIVQ